MIIHGNCLDVVRGMERESVALTLTSPPYDGVRDYNGYDLDLLALGHRLYDVTMDGGMCAVVMQDGTHKFAKSLTSFTMVTDWCRHAGWRLFETCIYHRHGRPGAWWSKRFRIDHEFIFLFLKGARPRVFSKEHMAVPSKHAGRKWGDTTTQRNTDGSLTPVKGKVCKPTKCRGTIWSYNPSNSEWNALKNQHPAAFPDALASDIIRTFTKRGDLVLDPMCGSGTTCVMAKKLRRKFVGCDISEEYTALAERRLKEEANA